MARLPDRIEMSPQRAAQLALGSTYQGDFGLDEVSAGFMRARAGVQERAKEEAVKAAAARDTGFVEQYAQNVHLADRPDFTMNQTQTWKTLHDLHAKGLSPDARLYYERQGVEDQLQAHNRASAAQMARSEDKRRTQDAYKEYARMSGAGIDALVALNPLKRELTDNFTGEHDGLVTDFEARAQAVKAAAVAAAPDADKAAVGHAFDAQIASDAGELMRKQEERSDAWRFGKVKENLDVLNDQVRRFPGSLQTAQAILDLTLSPLGAGNAQRMRPGAISDMHAAYLDSFVNADDPEGGLAAMDKGDLHLSDAAATKYRNAFTTAVTSERHEVQEVHNRQDLQADIVARETQGGVGTGFNPDVFRKPKDRDLAHQMQVQATETGKLMKNVPTMTDGDYATFRASIVPKVGANGLYPPDYDVQMHRVEVADKIRSDTAVALRKDPASVIYQDPTMKGLISRRGASVSANEAYAQAQHDTQVARQNGPGEEGWHLLRADEAHDIAALTKGPPVNWLNGMLQVQNQARGYGRFEGQYIRDLESLGGLDTADAGVLKVGMGKAGIEAYVVGRAASKTDGMPPTEVNDLRGLVRAPLQPLLKSLRDSGAEGQLLAQQIEEAATYTARGYVPTKGPHDAATAAAKWYLDMYQIAPSGFRVPTWQVPKEVDVWIQPIVARGQPAGPAGSRVSGAAGVEVGLSRDVQEIVRTDGAGLYPKPFAGATDDEQRRRLYAEEIRTAGRWVTLGDDSGYVLTTPNPSNGPRLWVKRADGTYFTRTSKEALDAAGKPPKTARGVSPLAPAR